MLCMPNGIGRIHCRVVPCWNKHAPWLFCPRTPLLPKSHNRFSPFLPICPKTMRLPRAHHLSLTSPATSELCYVMHITTYTVGTNCGMVIDFFRERRMMNASLVRRGGDIYIYKWEERKACSELCDRIFQAHHTVDCLGDANLQGTSGLAVIGLCRWLTS